MSKPEQFRQTYTGKSKERYNKAIRAEMPGGNVLIDTLLDVHQLRRDISRTNVSKEEVLRRLEDIEDSIQDIRDDMVKEIQKRYNLPQR